MSAAAEGRTEERKEGEESRQVVRLLDKKRDFFVVDAAADPSGLCYANSTKAVPMVVDETTGEECFQIKGSGTCWSSSFVELNELREYQFSLGFRFADSSVSHRGYFAIDCFDGDFRRISAHEISRKGNAAILTGYTPDYSVIFTDRELRDWNGDGSQCHGRSIAFFNCGNESTTVKPDFLLKTYSDPWTSVDPTQGAYSKCEGRRILLTEMGSAALKKAIDNGITSLTKGHSIVRNVYGSGTFIYPWGVAKQGPSKKQGETSTAVIKSEWVELEPKKMRCCQGIDFTNKSYPIGRDVFRPDTKYIKIGYPQEKGVINVNYFRLDMV